MLHAYNSFDMSECDYMVIDNFLQCLYGTCLLPYPEFINLPQVGGENEADLLREVEWDAATKNLLRVNGHHVRVGTGGCSKIGLPHEQVKALRDAAKANHEKQ